MAEDWEGYWKRKTILTGIVDFMRINYFAYIPLNYLGDLKGKTVLEAGCGTSETLVKVAKKAKKTVGMDISQKALDRSRINFEINKVPKDRYSLVLGDILNMKFKDNTFDVVFNTGVAEHFDDEKINNRPVEEMVRITKKGGKIVILVPSVYTPFYWFYLITRIPILRRFYPWEPHRFYTRKMLKDQIKVFNLKFKTIIDFTSIYIIAIIYKK